MKEVFELGDVKFNSKWWIFLLSAWRKIVFLHVKIIFIVSKIKKFIVKKKTFIMWKMFFGVQKKFIDEIKFSILWKICSTR